MDREAIPDSQAKICLVFHEQKQKRKMKSFTLLWELVMCLLSTYLKYTYFQTRAFKARVISSEITSLQKNTTQPCCTRLSFLFT